MRLVVGRIGRPHGVKGEVTVEVRTDSPEERFVVGKALETDPADVGPLTITAQRWHKDRLLVRFEEVPDRTAAEQLRGVFLVVDSAELPRWTTPTSSTTTSSSACGWRRSTAKRSEKSWTSCTTPRTCWWSAGRKARRSSCRSSASWSPTSTPRQAVSSSTRPRPAGTRSLTVPCGPSAGERCCLLPGEQCRDAEPGRGRERLGCGPGPRVLPQRATGSAREPERPP